MRPMTKTQSKIFAAKLATAGVLGTAYSYYRADIGTAQRGNANHSRPATHQRTAKYIRGDRECDPIYVEANSSDYWLDNERRIRIADITTLLLNLPYSTLDELYSALSKYVPSA